MLKLLKVSGDSLFPEYKEGDFVFISKVPLFFFPLKPGDIVVFRQPVFGVMIKMIEKLIPDEDRIYVIGTNENSVDSRRFGAIRKSDLLGKVIWHIKKP